MKAANRVPRRGEAGYTLLIVAFLIASMIVLLTAATPSLIMQGRRDREQEMIWRGNQYVRAIGLYYRRNGHYHSKIDDLYKGTNGIRYLRKEYKDPMNTTDGSWRPIYIGPNGQLIGSTNYSNLLQMGITGSVPTGAPSAGPAGTTQSAAPPGAQQGTTPAGATQTQDQSESQLSPLGGEVIGGNLIGVGSKVKKPSIKVVNGASNYYHWEFIWRPIQVVGAPSQAPAQAPAAGAAGTGGTPNQPEAPGAATPPLNNFGPQNPPETPAPPANPDQPPQ